MKRSPLGATTMLHGSVSASGGLPAMPGVPIVMRTLPSGSNLTTCGPPVLRRDISASPSRSSRACRHPDVAIAVDVDLVREDEQARAEALQDVSIGVELVHRRPARAGAAVVLEGRCAGGTSGFAPQRSTTQTERPSLSIATPLNAPHCRDRQAGCPTARRSGNGFGRSLVGVVSRFDTGCEMRPAQPAAAAAIATRVKRASGLLRMGTSSPAMLRAVANAPRKMKGPARGGGLGARLSGRRLAGRLFLGREGGRGEPAKEGQVSRRVAGNPTAAAAGRRPAQARVKSSTLRAEVNAFNRCGLRYNQVEEPPGAGLRGAPELPCAGAHEASPGYLRARLVKALTALGLPRNELIQKLFGR